MEDARLVDVTASMIAATLARHGGNVSAAARALGVSRNTIYRKMPAADSSRGSGDA
jgi:transcriptional regulator of acetoin/glycerol metabolism